MPTPRLRKIQWISWIVQLRGARKPAQSAASGRLTRVAGKSFSKNAGISKKLQLLSLGKFLLETSLWKKRRSTWWRFVIASSGRVLRAARAGECRDRSGTTPRHPGIDFHAPCTRLSPDPALRGEAASGQRNFSKRKPGSRFGTFPRLNLSRGNAPNR